MKAIRRGAAAALSLLLSCEAALAASAVIDSGALKGTNARGVDAYLGVPFAAPPIDGLRWREPQSVATWQGVRMAKKYAPACMQNTVSMPGEVPPSVSEDCLYLNLWAPSGRGRTKLPVFVWIYGGGYNSGSASMPLYRGDRLATRGVIIVTIAYRVGALGYLAHPTLTKESPHHTSGNYGLMDQIAALQWIQRNIRAFGGDPQRVTIAGQSAGSMAVSMLMASPRAKGLFQRAIGQSGGLFEPLQLAPFYLLTNAERDGEDFAASVGAKSIDELRMLPAVNLLGGSAARITHPVIEPYTLPESPYDVFASGRQQDVPLLIGSNADEARSLVDVSNVRAATFGSDLGRAFGPLASPEVMAAYPHTTDADAKHSRLEFERDLRFGWDMWAWARLQAMTGQQPVYYYYFKQRPPFPAHTVYAGWGASHYAELWYVFDHLQQEPWQWSAADSRLADTMAGYWTNFAKTGDPNGTGLPHWPAFTESDGKLVYLSDPVTIDGPANLDKLRVLDSIYTAMRAAPNP